MNKQFLNKHVHKQRNEIHNLKQFHNQSGTAMASGAIFQVLYMERPIDTKFDTCMLTLKVITKNQINKIYECIKVLARQIVVLTCYIFTIFIFYLFWFNDLKCLTKLGMREFSFGQVKQVIKDGSHRFSQFYAKLNFSSYQLPSHRKAEFSQQQQTKLQNILIDADPRNSQRIKLAILNISFRKQRKLIDYKL